jgi:hypothetical protein
MCTLKLSNKVYYTEKLSEAKRKDFFLLFVVNITVKLTESSEKLSLFSKHIYAYIYIYM